MRWEYESLSKDCMLSLVAGLKVLGQFGYECVGWQQTEVLIESSPGIVETRRIYEAVLKREVPESKPADFIEPRLDQLSEDPHWPDGPPAESTDPTTRAEDLMESHGDVPDPRR